MRKIEPRQIVDLPRRTRRQMLLERLRDIGALLIAFGIVVAAAIALL